MSKEMFEAMIKLASKPLRPSKRIADPKLGGMFCKKKVEHDGMYSEGTMVRIKNSERKR